jgi:hypothetical protein
VPALQAVPDRQLNTEVVLKNAGTGLCLTGEASDPTAFMSTCVPGAANQEWWEGDVYGTLSAYAYSTFKNVATQTCLQANGAGDVFLGTCLSGFQYQEWIKFGDNPLQFVNGAYTSLLLDSDGATVFVAGGDNGPDTNWDDTAVG